ncbi:hypothetical protein [Leptothoe sp. PORK10 BA2]|uniref:hypothetical protein n=1 Tax=Leptothoe sp. PORK10 BA2 TaxID=3110254 RepID=UPI002B21B464|nr:hypothetical protein [Leptothoe sp. PORK10 BA2]MEA5464782.1 hypothetical protein [Leptothoe sp. PORK10 BA2]
MQSTTTQLLSGKVDSVLAAYPAEPYGTALSHVAVKRLLLDYVECKLKQAMPSLNDPDQWQRLPHHLQQLVDLELRLESYIYWGIEYIIQNKFDLLLSAEKSEEPAWSLQDMTQACVPAHWFG